jgi:hypothetical protein
MKKINEEAKNRGPKHMGKKRLTKLQTKNIHTPLPPSPTPQTHIQFFTKFSIHHLHKIWMMDRNLSLCMSIYFIFIFIFIFKKKIGVDSLACVFDHR